MFNTVEARYGAAATDQDRKVGRETQAYFAQFAKAGDPAPSGLPAWPRSEARSDLLMDSSAGGAPVAGADPWKARLDVTAAAASAN
ncbi:carboxylesterase family protein [Stigmatella erecta]|uniref:Para-nitrobenzyl esterase n=1 Tax=Stigmatella erecta TaxID=83460 RepID=A0A1I0GS05_9BACT|nr:para-nitrobenzyl esterase [Stigmatella erecta]